jgi:hypothetical protein
MTMTHRDLHAMLSQYPLPDTYQATIETDTGPNPEGGDTMTYTSTSARIVQDGIARMQRRRMEQDIPPALTIQEQRPMISDTEARRIASDWHGGGGTALYAFASTGAINTTRADHDIENEVLGCVNGALSQQDKTDTLKLLAYINTHEDRGPQPGWSDLAW